MYIMLLVSIILAIYLSGSDEFAVRGQVGLFPVAWTKYGFVEGDTGISRLGRSYYSFKGIPYAAPPLGNLRFSSPIEPDSWEDVRDAKQHGPICVQTDDLFVEHAPVSGEEDCLYINVYTPQLPEEGVELLPVMVFIHYGGLFSGNGNSDSLGPQFLIDRDVLVVTFNYRLALFGFLSTGDDASPGNYAFKDQNMALKWVRDNIAYFGGDNKRVTIFGQSAGAGSVHHHVLSPSSKDLFHGAISQSGAALSLWAFPINGTLSNELATKNLALLVGCSTNVTNEEMIKCLRGVKAYDLANSALKFRYFQDDPLNSFLPTLEIKTEKNPNPFITETPIQIIREKKFNHVPWISGVTEDEGILRSAPLLRNATLAKELNENFNEYGVKMFGIGYSVAPDNILPTWTKVIDEYLKMDGVNTSNPDSVQGFTNLYSDRAFDYGSYQSVMAHALNGHHPIWYYSFNYRGAHTYGDKFALIPDDISFNWGVSHCDDLLYLFHAPKYFPDPVGTDCGMVELMLDLWTNFAKFGDPTPADNILETIPVKWEPVRDLSSQTVAYNSDLRLLNISGQFGVGIEVGMETGYHSKRMNFWTDLKVLEAFPNVH